VLVSEAVRDRAGDAFGFRFVAKIKPKGFAAEVAVFELLSDD
jgi:adenylate cyclase